MSITYSIVIITSLKHGNYRVFIKYCVFFEDFKIYSGLWLLSVAPRCQCVYTMVGQTQALAA